MTAAGEEERPLLLVCGILKKEIAFLIEKDRLRVDTAVLDSSLHVNFGKLERALSGTLARHAKRRQILLYGACHPRMNEMLSAAGATRVEGQNCVEFLLGTEAFSEELSKGAFFLLEDWVRRWDQVVVKTFGGSPEVTREIFQADRKYLLGLRTPCSGDFTKEAEEISRSIGLPLLWRDVSLDRLETALLDALRPYLPEASPDASPEEVRELRGRVGRLAREKAHLQLLNQLMERLTTTTGLDNVVDNILGTLMDTIGGTNLVLYYRSEGAIHHADILGKRETISAIDDPAVRKVMDTGEFLEEENLLEMGIVPGSILPIHNWVFPMKVDADCFGALKMEGVMISGKDMHPQLVSFAKYASLVLNKEICNYDVLRRALEDTREMNRKLVGEIAERKEAEVALRHSEELLRQSQKMEAVGRLAGGVAHDFNNLLTVINGYAAMLQESLGESPYRREVGEILDAGERAAALTRQLLAFSRKQVLEMKVLDLNRVVVGLERMLRRLIGEDVELGTDLSPDLWPIKADAGQIEQAVVNLAVNARDSMPKGGKLTIETRNRVLDERFAMEHPPLGPGPHVVLSLSDTGIGMDEETKARIFEPFFTTKPKGTGTGLGLSTVYGIVSQSCGHIDVRTGPGKGATFEIHIPRADEPLEQAVAEKPGAVPSGGETVLLVEDSESVRNLVLRVLAGLGYKVIVATNGREGIAAARSHPGRIDLLVTDVVMPEMGGLELSERLSAVRPETKILFISGYTDATVSQKKMLDTGKAYLQKPFTPDALARKVRDVLERPAVRGDR